LVINNIIKYSYLTHLSSKKGQHIRRWGKYVTDVSVADARSLELGFNGDDGTDCFCVMENKKIIKYLGKYLVDKNQIQNNAKDKWSELCKECGTYVDFDKL